MRKNLSFYLLALLGAVLFVAGWMAPNAGAVTTSDEVRISTVIKDTPPRPTEEACEIVATWVPDNALEAPSETTITYKVLRSTDYTTWDRLGRRIDIFKGVDFPSVGNYVFKVKLKAVSSVINGKSLPLANGTTFVDAPEEHEVIVAVRSADPQKPGQDLKASVIQKESDLNFEPGFSKPLHKDIVLSQKTKGLMGNKADSFEYELDASRVRNAMIRIILNGKRHTVITDPILYEERIKNNPSNDILAKDKITFSLKDGETANIQYTFEGDDITIRQLTKAPGYVTSVNGQTGIDNIRMIRLPVDDPQFAQQNSIIFENRREGSPATGIALKVAPFIGIAGMGGIGAFIIYKTRKRR